MNNLVTIRPAEASDRPALVGFMAALQDTERQLWPNRPAGSAIADAHLQYLEAQVAQHQGKILVAVTPTELAGFLVCFIECLDEGDLHLITSERAYGFISDLYVVPTLRHAGVASALMQAAEAHFKALQLSTMRVAVLANNPTARAFYERVGYHPYEMIYHKSL